VRVCAAFINRIVMFNKCGVNYIFELKPVSVQTTDTAEIRTGRDLVYRKLLSYRKENPINPMLGIKSNVDGVVMGM